MLSLPLIFHFSPSHYFCLFSTCLSLSGSSLTTFLLSSLFLQKVLQFFELSFTKKSCCRKTRLFCRLLQQKNPFYPSTILQHFLGFSIYLLFSGRWRFCSATFWGWDGVKLRWRRRRHLSCEGSSPDRHDRGKRGQRRVGSGERARKFRLGTDGKVKRRAPSFYEKLFARLNALGDFLKSF